MVPDSSEMSRTSVVLGILDIPDGSGMGQPRAVKLASARSAPRTFSCAIPAVGPRYMQKMRYISIKVNQRHNTIDKKRAGF